MGIVWSAAFGRRLARSRILNLNINETWYVVLESERWTMSVMSANVACQF